MSEQRISGRVYERQSGTGLGGLVVGLRTDGDGCAPAGATTAADGRFALPVVGKAAQAAERLEVRSPDERHVLPVSARCLEVTRGGISADLAIDRDALGALSPTAGEGQARGRLRVRVTDEKGNALDAPRRLLVTEQRPDSNRQARASREGSGDFEVDVRPGSHTLQVGARGFAPVSRAVQVAPAGAEEVEVALQQARASKPRTFEEIVKRYGLGDRVKPVDLTLERDQRVRLDRRVGREVPGYAELQPKTIGDLKRYIGTPDHVFGHELPRFGPVPRLAGEAAKIPSDKADYAQVSVSTRAAIEAIANEYVQGNSASVSAYEPLLNAYMSQAIIDIIIHGWFFNTVTIGPGAVLELGTTQTVLTASLLRVHITGLLEIDGPSTIDIGTYEEFS
jgi:hypothetical protein